jgi:putative tricarboxylic transport membrane protein
MGIFDHLALGFGVAFTVNNLLFCFLGVLIGTLIGVLPGIGPVATISLLLPVTFGMNPVTSIIMLAGVYYGAQYGGSTTSILVNIPGEASSIVTCLDGYQMARQGRAGPALGMAAFGSFIGGTASIVGLMLLAPILARAALRFGPPEYFALMFFGLTMVIYLCVGSITKGLIMAAAGLAISMVGQDPVTGSTRFTMGSITLMDGLGIVPVAMGVFGIGEVLTNIEENIKQEVLSAKISGLLPTLKDWKDCKWPIARGTIIGFFLGILPGGGVVIPTFMSYAVV